MAVNVNISLEKDSINKGTVYITDFTILGFKINDKFIDFFYLMQDDKSVEYLIKESFIMSDEDEKIDKLFLNTPAHKYLNINNMDEDNKKIISDMINNVSADNSYYCSFSNVSILDRYEYVNCICTQTNENKQYNISLKLPFCIYLKIQIFKNNMLHKIIMNANLDNDDRFNNIEIHKNAGLNYIGCEVNNNVIVEFFSLNIEKINNNNKIGLFSCIPMIKNDKIIKSKFITKEQFGVLYKDPLPVDMSKILLLDWDNGSKKIGLFYIIKGVPTLYLLNDNPLECPLLNPLSVLF